MKKSIALLVALFSLAFAQPASAQDATIMLLHGIPDTNVDVVVDGAVVIEDYAFGEMEDLSAFAGTTLTALTVNPTGTDDVVIDLGDFDVPASGNYTVVAYLDAEGTPTAKAFENDTSTVAAGNGRLIVRHTAAAPLVDVLADGAEAFGDVANGDEGKADLPAGTISAEVVAANSGGPAVIGPADVPVTEGEAIIVYAVGSLADDNLGVLTQSITGLAGAPSAVNTGNSPVSDGAGANTALLVAAGALLLGLGVVGTRRLATVTR